MNVKQIGKADGPPGAQAKPGKSEQAPTEARNIRLGLLSSDLGVIFIS